MAWIATSSMHIHLDLTLDGIVARVRAIASCVVLADAVGCGPSIACACTCMNTRGPALPWHPHRTSCARIRCLFQQAASLHSDCCLLQELQGFWRDIQKNFEGEAITTAFFTGLWLERARHYRIIAEQLDIANWYYCNKHIARLMTGGKAVGEFNGSHYISGLDGPDEYSRNAEGGLEGVKDNHKRPGRFQLIQERELLTPNAEGERAEPKSSLELARLMQKLGTGATGVLFAESSKWPQEFVVRHGDLIEVNLCSAAAGCAACLKYVRLVSIVCPALLAAPLGSGTWHDE
jgi:hypothetical protein